MNRGRGGTGKGPATGHGAARARSLLERRKLLSVLLASLMMVTSFAVVNLSTDAAAETLPAEAVTVPWTSAFTPTTTAWDSTGTHCVVAGGSTSPVESSAWHYQYDGVSDTGTWTALREGSDPTLPAVNIVLNSNTGMTYGFIQNAINAASPGDTIEVWSGVYLESIVVDRQLTLAGNGSANTRIHGGMSGPAVTVTANGVRIDGFNMTGSSGNAGILLDKVQNCRIENNTVYGNSDGICLTGSSNNVIVRNDIINNQAVGVRAEGVTGSMTLVGTTDSGGPTDYGTMFGLNTDGSDYNIMHEFKEGYADGFRPVYNTLVADIFDPSLLYGCTPDGGLYGKGVLFREKTDGSDHTVLHNFKAGPDDGYNPFGSVVQSGNELYGTTRYGGSADFGVIYKINTDGSGFTVLHAFTGSPDGNNPHGSLTLVGGTLYGMTYGGGSQNRGSIFRINTDGSGYSVIFNFTGGASGQYPYGSLLHDSGVLYGMTSSGGASNVGAVFRINTDGSGFLRLYSFLGPLSGDGAQPYGDLIMDTDGFTLYGMTYGGGQTSNYGTIFGIYADGTAYWIIHDFDHNLGSQTGSYPYGSLVQDNDYLYGMTSGGGANDMGTIFRMRKDMASCNVLYHLDGINGRNPYGSLMYDGLWLYGMTRFGGANDFGSVFKIQNDGSAFISLHSFPPNTAYGDGIWPYGGLIQDGTTIYGTFSGCGALGKGGIYRIQTDGSGFQILHDFTGSPAGATPYAGLTLSGTTLYGTTALGGNANMGSMFKINTDGTGYETIHNFTGAPTDGSNPQGGLMLDGTMLYGLTVNGGANNYGTLFRYDTVTKDYTVIHQFLGGATDGREPYGSVIQDGVRLYGMTSLGGTSNYGIIFRMNKDGTGFSVEHSFGASGDGRSPYGTPVLDGSTLYGITSGGGFYSGGNIFSYRVDTMQYTSLYDLDTPDGYTSRGSLIQDGAMLYGMAVEGGANNYGTIFSFNKTTSAFQVLHDFAGWPTDAAYPYDNDLLLVDNSVLSTGNLIYRNNFIGNFQHAQDDSGPNSWYNSLPMGGNHWGGFTAIDIEPDGIGDDPYYIPGTASAIDGYPWLQSGGWFRMRFTSVEWDNVNQRFWLIGEVSAYARSEVYYIPAAAPNVMVPIPTGEPITFTAMAVDTSGNILVAGNDLSCMYYYNPVSQEAFSITESVSGLMNGWNITDITFNPNDGRFYIVGIETNSNPKAGVAFFTDPVPMGVGSMCYLVANTPSFDMASIAWNAVRNCGLAVGAGVYRLEAYDGTPPYDLAWETIQPFQAGKYYNGVSWDAWGNPGLGIPAWDQASIVGVNNTHGTFWRYYDSNRFFMERYADPGIGTAFMAGAIKPPYSPLYSYMFGTSRAWRIEIGSTYEGGDVTLNMNMPHMLSIKMYKSSDVTQADLLNRQVDANSTYTFLIEGNYTVGGFERWSDLNIVLSAWYDGGNAGSASLPGDWANNDLRTRQFNISYSVASGSAVALYPSSVGGISEFQLHSTWHDPNTYGPEMRHRVMINVTFGPQTYAADGNGFLNGGAGGGMAWDKNSALNDAHSWDLQVHMYDASNTASYNLSYEEFGVKESASIYSVGNPGGSAPPGAVDYLLSSSSIIHYSVNTDYVMNISISDLHLNGDQMDPNKIPAGNMMVRNIHSLAPGNSEISGATAFSGPGVPLYIWNASIWTTISAPLNGLQSAGPGYSDYTVGFNMGSFEATEIVWWVTVPPLPEGIYRATITLTIGN